MSRRGRPSLPWAALAVGILKPILTVVVKRDWRDMQKIPRDGGLIIAANHLSYSDPLFFAHYTYNAGRWPVFLAKSSIFDIKPLGFLMHKFKQIPVYRDRMDAALALRDAEQGLKDGACIIFYPEGTVTRDPDLWPMEAKTGVARLALKSGVPVIPVAHWGAHELLPYGDKKPRFRPRKTFHALAGPPVDLSKYEGLPLTTSTLKAATADIMHDITLLLAEIRKEAPPAAPYSQREKAHD